MYDICTANKLDNNSKNFNFNSIIGLKQLVPIGTISTYYKTLTDCSHSSYKIKLKQVVCNII